MGLVVPWHVESSWTRDRTVSPMLAGRALVVDKALGRNIVFIYFILSLCSVVSDSLLLHGLYLTRLLCPWNFPGKHVGLVYHFLLQGDLLDPGIKPVSPALAGGFFTTELPGKALKCS